MTPTVVLAKDLERGIRRGHPWIYDRALRPGRDLTVGALVRVAGPRGPIALGFADPSSPIRVRLLSRDPAAAIDDAWVAARAVRAARLRVLDRELADVSGLRLIHGEADGLPGLVIDRYADAAVCALDGDGASAFWRPRLPAVWAGLAAGGMGVASAWLRSRGRPAERLHGTPPERVEITEHGARFEVDLVRGQKTGFFLDQRPNRRRLGARAAGRTVLNLFGYTGGFSVHAGLGGAAEVTTVDVAEAAITAARGNWERNRLPAGRHRAVCADVFTTLGELGRDGRRFDLVVCDPPSFAPSEKSLATALVAYQRLHREALGRVAPGGLLVAGSCSSHVSEDAFLATLAAAAVDCGRTTRVIFVGGAGSDHPVHPGFPEGRYLKLVELAVD